MAKSSVNNIDIKVLNQVVEIVLSHKEVEKIVIFGSRATNDFSDVSDIDIAIFLGGMDEKRHQFSKR